MNSKYFETLIEKIPEGIIVMDRRRNIHYINPLAYEMTGWNVGESVPFCSYCRIREVISGDERCLLVKEDPSLVFEAHMPIASGEYEHFYMSTNQVHCADRVFILLVLHNPKWRAEQSQIRLKQLLVHETMLAQEGERKKISMELHDHIGQGIFSAFLSLQSLKHRIQDEKLSKLILNMERSLEESLDSVKQLSKQLHPVLLEHLGFEKAMTHATEEWSQLFGIKIEFETDSIPDPFLTNEASLHLFRVIQEAVHNAVRHGKATNIRITLRLSNTNLYFEIVDNGNGFKPEDKKHTGLGISHMLERLNIVDGEIKFSSQPGGPTRLSGFIPMSGVNLNECTHRR